MPVKVCSYNVNSVKARLDLILEWLDKRDNDLDVLCLQELKVPEEKFPFEHFEDLGYHSVVFGQRQYNGVAICSKAKPTNISKGFADAEWDEQKRLISCEIKGIPILNVYTPHGEAPGKEKYFYKLRWYSHLKEYLKANFDPEWPLIIAGDFNVTVNDEDVYDPEFLRDTICTTSDERKALQELVDWGLIDTFRYTNPNKTTYTWWSYIAGRIWKDEGLRIDYIFCSNPLLDSLKEVNVDMWPRRRRKPTPSDHAPLIAEFEIT